MTLDAEMAGSFYERRRGAIVTTLLRDLLASFWPDLRGLDILGVGHTEPYLDLWSADAAVCASFSGSRRDDAALPAAGPGGRRSILRAIVDDVALPLPDLSQDRILLVHGLEMASDTGRLLRECWRVLRDEGRLIVVTPNRVGAWAHAESTPFGQGEPFSSGQLQRLLVRGMFTVERRTPAIFVPPVGPTVPLPLARRLERAGRRLTPGIAGLLVVEAGKHQYATIPGIPARASGVARPQRATIAAN